MEGRQYKDEEKQQGSQCFSNLSSANWLLSILVRPQIGLLITDVNNHLKFLSQLTVVYLPHGFIFIKRTSFHFCFLLREQIVQWLSRISKKHFPNTGIITDCYKIECQHPLGLVNSSITYSHYKIRNTWKVSVRCTPSGLVSFILMLKVGKFKIGKLQKTELLDLLESGYMIMADQGF